MMTEENNKLTALAIRPGHGIEIHSNEDAMRFAQFVVQHRMSPNFKTPMEACIGIITGIEHGFSAMQSLSAVCVINNRPCLYGDALPALIHKSGKCEYLKEWFEGDGDTLTAHCEVKRNDQSSPTLRTFGIQDAKTAGLWNKSGPWRQYPKRMLQLRARGFAIRDGFADVLAGFAMVEEVRDYHGRSTFDPSQAQGAETVEIIDETEGDPMLADIGIESQVQPEADESTPPPADGKAAAFDARKAEADVRANMVKHGIPESRADEIIQEFKDDPTTTDGRDDWGPFYLSVADIAKRERDKALADAQAETNEESEVAA